MKPIRLRVTERAESAVVRGHPWVYREGIASGADAIETGGTAVLVGASGREIATAIVDKDSPIRARVWSLEVSDLGKSLVAARLTRAFGLRDRLFQSGATTAYRLLNGEGDRMPGYVIDRYGPVAVVRVDGEAANARLPLVLEVARGELATRGIDTVLLRSTLEKPEVHVLHGTAPTGLLEVAEEGVPLLVDVLRGQKTGAFLDQRENRRRVGAMARGLRVLNLCSYTGGFSLHAALGGATEVTSVDIAMAAHATAEQNFRAAGLDPKDHRFVTQDAFEYLAQAKRARETFDLVISDPPSFARNERSVPKALASYRRLHEACASVLASGGVFCASSCSSHVRTEEFLATLDDASLKKSGLRLQEIYGLPGDHPTLPAWPEGRYLKFAVLS